MRLLDRYLLREILPPLGYCLCGFTLFWIAFDFFSDLGRLQQLRLTELVEYYLCKAPGIVVTFFPIVLLMALLYALTAHARHFELTAMRAAGISLWRICVPYFLLGIAASLIVFALNEWYVPRSEDAAQKITERHDPAANNPAQRDRVTNFPFNNARQGRKWYIGVYNSHTAEMLNPSVTWAQPGGSLLRLRAARADYTNGVWVFRQASVFVETNHSDDVPVLKGKTNMLAMPEFRETPEDFNRELKISLRLSRGFPGGPADLSINEIRDYLRLNPDPDRATRSWIYTTLHGRIADPWTSLVVVFIAIPFAAASGRRNVFIGVASAIVICFAFYVLQRLSLALGLNGSLPGWLAAWLPNLAFGLTGAALTARVR